MIVNLALMSGFLIIFAVNNYELGLTNNKESSRLWLKQLI